ncbi:MAG: glycosyltransferase family 39 protein, partial [Chloroflexi bacterium]|nr:glycosyltransferase family 39 protein [Chloroflexota bacterium]
MSPRTRQVALLLLVLALAAALVGQHYLSHKPEFMWDGLLMLGGAMVLFVAAAARLEPRAARERAGGGLLAEWWQTFYGLLQRDALRLGTLVAGLALVAIVAVAAGHRNPNVASWDLLIIWLLGVVMTGGAFIDWRALPGQALRLARAAVTPEGLFVLLLALGTFLLRVVNLENVPYVLSGDEASMGLEARAVIDGVSRNPFVTGWLSHPTLYFFLQAGFLRLFGQTTTALRLSSALVSGCTVVLLYLFARRHYGRTVAAVAGIFFAGYHFAIHYGRLGVNNIWDPFFALGAFYFVMRGLERKRAGDLVLGGTLLGLAVYFYTGARLIPVLLLAFVLYWALTERDSLRTRVPHLLVVFVCALAAALPLLVYFAGHMNDMMARWTMMGIFPSGWVDYQVQTTGQSVAAVVWGQFLKALLGYNLYPDPTFWYHPGIPLFQFLPAVFFVLGSAYALSRVWERRYLMLVVWFLAVIVFGGALLENPPSSFRLVLSIPVAVMLMAVGVVKALDLLRLALNKPRVGAVVAAVVLALAMSYQSAHFYLAEYTPA